MTAMGHEERLPPRRLSGRCRVGGLMLIRERERPKRTLTPVSGVGDDDSGGAGDGTGFSA
jgi:hypothetical protein